MNNSNNNIKDIENNDKTTSINFKYFIGVDVAKSKFDIYNDIDGETKTILNQKQFIEKLCDGYLTNLLKDNNLTKDDILVVIDLTGGYERELLNTFYNKGFTHILLAEGLKVKNFSKATKYNRAKTDKQDSYILAEYGKMFYKELKLYEPMSENREEITRLYNRIEDFKNLIKREKNRYKAPNVYENITLRESIERNIKHMEEEIKIIKKEIIRIIESDRELGLIYSTLLNQEGIGEEISMFLLIKVKELGKIRRKELTSICGLAPVADDSGTHQGHRYIRGGRKLIKSMLYLCIMNLGRFSKDTKHRLNYYCDKNKKSTKVAFLALARKKIVVINAIIRRTLLKEGLITREDIR